MTAPGTRKPLPKVTGWWKYHLPDGGRNFPFRFPFVLAIWPSIANVYFTGSGALENLDTGGDLPAIFPFELGVYAPTAHPTLPGHGALTATAKSRYLRSSALSGHGTLSASTSSVLHPERSAAFSGQGTLAAQARTVAVVSFAGNSISASRSPAITFPTTWTPALNDLVIVWPSSTTTATITNVAGWTNPLGSGIDVESGVHEISCGYHFVTAGEVTAVTRSWTLTNWYDANETGNIVGCIVRGAATSSTVDSINSKFDAANNASPHITASLTGANLSNGSLVLSCIASDGPNTYAADPAGWARITTNNTNQGKILLQRNALTTAGSDVAEASTTPGNGDEYVSITIAITD